MPNNIKMKLVTKQDGFPGEVVRFASPKTQTARSTEQPLLTKS